MLFFCFVNFFFRVYDTQGARWQEKKKGETEKKWAMRGAEILQKKKGKDNKVQQRQVQQQQQCRMRML